MLLNQVGDDAVELLGVLSAKEMGAKRIIAMSRHQARQKLAREFGATDIMTKRADEGVARIKTIDQWNRRSTATVEPGFMFAASAANHPSR